MNNIQQSYVFVKSNSHGSNICVFLFLVLSFFYGLKKKTAHMCDDCVGNCCVVFCELGSGGFGQRLERRER